MASLENMQYISKTIPENCFYLFQENLCISLMLSVLFVKQSGLEVVSTTHKNNNIIKIDMPKYPNISIVVVITCTATFATGKIVECDNLNHHNTHNYLNKEKSDKTK